MIIGNYGRAKCFIEHREFFEKIFSEKRYTKLQELNEAIIFYLFKCFNIHPKIIRSSELKLDISLAKTDLNIELVKQAGGDVYISGISGKEYLETEKFEKEGIKLKYFEFRPFTYQQRWEGFESNMSAIDLLFNETNVQMK